LFLETSLVGVGDLSDDRCMTTIATSSLHSTEPSPSALGLSGVPILVEAVVVDATCAHLESRGWRIDHVARTTARGEDIVAERAGVYLTIEAKGAGSSQRHTRRYGRPFDKGQVFICVSTAALKAMKAVSSGQRRAGLAFPDNAAFRLQVGEIAVALAALCIAVFWVAEDGTVAIDSPWPV
jgi:hypothetical protein